MLAANEKDKQVLHYQDLCNEVTFVREERFIYSKYLKFLIVSLYIYFLRRDILGYGCIGCSFATWETPLCNGDVQRCTSPLSTSRTRHAYGEAITWSQLTHYSRVICN